MFEKIPHIVQSLRQLADDGLIRLDCSNLSFEVDGIRVCLSPQATPASLEVFGLTSEQHHELGRLLRDASTTASSELPVAISVP